MRSKQRTAGSQTDQEATEKERHVSSPFRYGSEEAVKDLVPQEVSFLVSTRKAVIQHTDHTEM